MKYIKKPIPVDAVQWKGDNVEEILDFMAGNSPIFKHDEIIISTLEGNMRAPLGSYIIRGVDGEYYPCRNDIFEKTYRQVNDHLIKCNNCNQSFMTNVTNVFYDALDQKYKYWGICPYCGIKNDWEI